MFKNRVVYELLGPSWVLITMAMAPVMVVFYHMIVFVIYSGHGNLLTGLTVRFLFYLLTQEKVCWVRCTNNSTIVRSLRKKRRCNSTAVAPSHLYISLYIYIFFFHATRFVEGMFFSDCIICARRHLRTASHQQGEHTNGLIYISC